MAVDGGLMGCFLAKPWLDQSIWAAMIATGFAGRTKVLPPNPSTLPPWLMPITSHWRLDDLASLAT